MTADFIRNIPVQPGDIRHDGDATWDEHGLHLDDGREFPVVNGRRVLVTGTLLMKPGSAR